jgi:hypothetical protein
MKKLITISPLALGRLPTPEEEVEFINVALILANDEEMKIIYLNEKKDTL